LRETSNHRAHSTEDFVLQPLVENVPDLILPGRTKRWLNASALPVIQTLRVFSHRVGSRYAAPEEAVVSGAYTATCSPTGRLVLFTGAGTKKRKIANPMAARVEAAKRHEEKGCEWDDPRMGEKPSGFR